MNIKSSISPFSYHSNVQSQKNAVPDNSFGSHMEKQKAEIEGFISKEVPDDPAEFDTPEIRFESILGRSAFLKDDPELTERFTNHFAGLSDTEFSSLYLTFHSEYMSKQAQSNLNVEYLSNPNKENNVSGYIQRFNSINNIAEYNGEYNEKFSSTNNIMNYIDQIIAGLRENNGEDTEGEKLLLPIKNIFLEYKSKDDSFEGYV